MTDFDMAERYRIALLMLDDRIDHAQKKHPGFAKDAFDALNVIEGEMQELRQAVHGESRKRQVDEALDVAATCIRFIVGEHLFHGRGA